MISDGELRQMILEGERLGYSTIVEALVELEAYRQAFSEPAGWLLIDEERTNPGFTERELIKDFFMVIERHSHEPLYRKPAIPE